MSLACSKEEIEQKRKQALKIRESRRNVTTLTTHATASIGSPIDRGKNQSGSAGIQIGVKSGQLSSQSFYSKTKVISQAQVLNDVSTQKPVYRMPILKQKLICTAYLITETRFEVNMPQFNQHIIDVFKSIPSKLYDPITRLWSFNLTDYDSLQEKANGLKPDVIIEEIPKNIRKLLENPRDDLKSYHSCLASIETKIANSLLPFQTDGVLFGISKNGRVMIADEMGLGKTIQALAISDFFKEDWPVLICTTASTRNSWMKHIREYLPKVSCHQTVCLTDGSQSIYDAKIVVTSYSLLDKQIDNFLSKHFRVLILDESHSLKNHEAKRTQNCDLLAREAKRVILLSGTPALSRPVELFSQLQMIDRKFLTFRNYTTRYCAGKQGTFGWDANGQSNLSELNVLLNRKFMIRRLKNDVLPDLAEKNRETVILDTSLIELNDDVKNDFSSYEEKLSQSTQKDILLIYYAKTAEVKRKAVCEYVKKLLKENMKFLIFAHHKVMMDAISECLQKENIDHIRVDGSTKNDIRNQLIDRFQNKDKCKVALLSLLACNSGITLTAAQFVIFAELEWNPSTLAQAESRAHRIGQTNQVTCRYLLAPNTADDLIWKMLKNKQKTLSTAGLFAEDIQDGNVVIASNSRRKSTLDSFVTKRKSTCENTAIKKENKKSKTEGKESEFQRCDENKNLSHTCDNVDYFQNLLDGDEDFFNIIDC